MNESRIYNDIVESLGKAGLAVQGSSSTSSKGNFTARPGWNEFVADFHQTARECFLTWVDDGKPKQEIVFDLMKRSRARFKYALRSVTLIIPAPKVYGV